MKVTHIKPNELSGGRAGAPIQSKAATGAGFKSGIDNTVAATKAAMPTPPSVRNNTGQSIQPRPGVWHPAAEKP